ncbi:hypothetical protein BS78_K322500 [Paspalum vaginatum]|uniref:Uncharacterized protein n=1 Tax=Paspalum vaginatum TaxID=158149 RepID=A0A9W7XDU5_9POAL|nr:hypothetical protein BS78_K322500 [Paspalum vaginatum]
MAWLCGTGVYARDPIGETSSVELLSFSLECGMLESVLSAEKCSLLVELSGETIAVCVYAFVFVGVRGSGDCPCSLARACDEYGEYRVGSQTNRKATGHLG